MNCLSSELLLKNNSNPEIAIQEIRRRLDKLVVKKGSCYAGFTSK
jgi:hypothetical protein